MTAFWKWPKLAKCMGYSPCKMVSLGQKLKIPKRCEKRLYDHIRVVVCKKPLQKNLIFEKWEHFENGQNWPRCMGYSPCKMVSLGQKLKMPKRCEKRFYDHIKVVVCKKPLQKNLIFEKWEHFENGQNWPCKCMGYSPCKMVSLGQKLKMPKRCEKRFLTTLKLMCAKNRSKKHLIFEKWEHFENGQNWPQCMGYSPCKMLSLGQKLKMPKRCEKRFYYHIKVVVCKKPLQKTPNIRKNDSILKMAKIGHDAWAIAHAKWSVWVKN